MAIVLTEINSINEATKGKSVGGWNNTANRANQSLRRTADPYRSGFFCEGIVEHSCAGLYSVTVHTLRHTEIICTLMTGIVSYYAGVSTCVVPTVGTRVMVYMPYEGAHYGLVVGIVPAAETMPTGEGPYRVSHLWEVEPAVTTANQDVYSYAHKDSNDVDVLNANTGRPMDVFPGNQVWINEQGVGLGILNFNTTLRGSDRARLDLSLLDDMVRITSGHFQHYNAQGVHQIYNDGGFITQEQDGTSYQCEHQGMDQYGIEVFADTGFNAYLTDPTHSRVQGTVTQPYCRWNIYWGYMGDILNFFVQNPTSKGAKGLFHTHVDASGRAFVRSASGISLQHVTSVPIPVKQFEPWDPYGDKVDGEYSVDEDGKATQAKKPLWASSADGGKLPPDEEAKRKMPIEWPDDHPYARSLQIRSSWAYHIRNAYRRMLDSSPDNSNKDWQVPDDSDAVPDDQYDKIGIGQESYKRFKHKHSFINLEDDGSIILRDAWGSEIIMRGGSIILSAAGQLELRSGKSTVVLAGDDLVMKARNSADLTATEKDVRIKANVNMQLVAEGRDGKGGGILLESKSTSDNASFGTDTDKLTGERVQSRGIMLKAKDSRIFCYGKNTHIAAHRNVIVETFNEQGKVQGNIMMVSKRFLSHAVTFNMSSCNKTSSLYIGRREAILAASQAIIASAKQSIIAEGTKIWIPFMKASIQDNIYELIRPTIEQQYDVLIDKDDWLKPFDSKTRQAIQFTYRSSAEYNTLQPIELERSTKFILYQSSWAAMLPSFGVTTKQWTEVPIDTTYPWPGADLYTGTTGYGKLKEEANIADQKTGKMKSWADITKKPGDITEQAFTAYEVLDEQARIY